MEASFAVLRILQVYERMEAVGGGETVEIDATLTMAPRETKVRLFRARAE